MATCKDCIHERVCFALIKSGLPYDDLLPAEAFCMTFKNKADVVEVRHSYWQCSNVRMSSRDITCRYCHRTETISNGSEDFEYCPHCGAKMDGKDGE